MNYIINNGELYHWGVKGMRWGVRRGKTSISDYEPKDGNKTFKSPDSEQPLKKPNNEFSKNKVKATIAATIITSTTLKAVSAALKAKGNEKWANIVETGNKAVTASLIASTAIDALVAKDKKDREERMRSKNG